LKLFLIDTLEMLVVGPLKAEYLLIAVAVEDLLKAEYAPLQLLLGALQTQSTYTLELLLWTLLKAEYLFIIYLGIYYISG